jgi:hypothetical protein
MSTGLARVRKRRRDRKVLSGKSERHATLRSCRKQTRNRWPGRRTNEQTNGIGMDCLNHSMRAEYEHLTGTDSLALNGPGGAP